MRVYSLIKGIIFDFDGVISQSITAKTNAFKEIYRPFGDDIVKKVVHHHESNGGISRFDKFSYYHKSFLNKNVTKQNISDLSDQFSKLVIDKVIDAPYVPGALEFIKESFKKFHLFISTGTPEKEIKKIIKKKQIDKYFMESFGSPSNKISHIEKIMKKYDLTPGEITFFGDSKTDLDAAENFNINFTLIRNDFNKILQSSYKGKMINDFKGLMN